MAEPRSFQVPPLRSMRSIRRICRKRRLLREVARTLPWFPTATTGTDAISTKMSGKRERESGRGQGEECQVDGIVTGGRCTCAKLGAICKWLCQFMTLTTQDMDDSMRVEEEAQNPGRGPPRPHGQK